MEGNEMNVLTQTHSDESEKDENSVSDSTSRQNRGGFRHFVEESTLRNVSLDELEELSEAGCIANADGNIRRTPSSVSSEQPERLVFILEWNNEYANRPEGMFRLALLVSSTISLALVTSAGTQEIDILDTAFSSSVRAHIFVTVFSILITVTFFVLGITSMVQSFPAYWNIIDAALHTCLCSLYIFTTVMLFRAEYSFRDHEPPLTNLSEVLVSLSAAFGFICTILCIFIAAIRACANKTTVVQDHIVLTSLRSS